MIRITILVESVSPVLRSFDYFLLGSGPFRSHTYSLVSRTTAKVIVSKQIVSLLSEVEANFPAVSRPRFSHLLSAGPVFLAISKGYSPSLPTEGRKQISSIRSYRISGIIHGITINLLLNNYRIRIAIKTN